MSDPTLETRNAIIDSVSISKADRGFLSAWLVLDYGPKGSQGFGGYDLESTGIHFLWRILEIAGVDEWEKLQGRVIRVRANQSGVHAIGHVLNDDWFCPEEDFKRPLAGEPEPSDNSE